MSGPPFRPHLMHQPIDISVFSFIAALGVDMNCALCERAADKLVKSHIIPKVLYGDAMKDPDGPMKLVPVNVEKHTQVSLTGIYDRIVCAGCEKSFDSIDDYFHKFLASKDFEVIKRPDIGPAEGRIYHNADKEQILLFLISLLWRSHSSKHYFFNNVDLGAYEGKAKQALAHKNSSYFKEFDAVITYFSDPTSRGFLNPYMEKMDGINQYRFSFAQYNCALKVDQRSFTGRLDKLSIRNAPAPAVIVREFVGSPEYRAMKTAVIARGPIYPRVDR